MNNHNNILIGENFINAMKSFYPEAKIASGGKEIVFRCRFCGDSKNHKNAHLYIKVPQESNEQAVYHCKKCQTRGIVDQTFLQMYNCVDKNIYESIMFSNKFTRYKNRSYGFNRSSNRNKTITNLPTADNFKKLDYINHRLGTNLSMTEATDLKIFFDLNKFISDNNLTPTKDSYMMNNLSKDYIGFVSQDETYATMRYIYNIRPNDKILRYVYYNFTNSNNKDNKTFYMVPMSFDLNDPTPFDIHIAEGVFDILGILYNVCNNRRYQSIYMTSSGKSYQQALFYIISHNIKLSNAVINIYPDTDVTDKQTFQLFLKQISKLSNNIIIHRNKFIKEKDFGIPKSKIISLLVY